MLAVYNLRSYSKVISNILFKNAQFQAFWPKSLRGNLFSSLLAVKQNILSEKGTTASFHTSHPVNEIKGVYEFFDDKENWGAKEVKVGRSWKKEELRIKGNEDLHKLWYVLLKEKNMLLTMEEACKEEYRVFPNPERIDKVEESMSNLETVVRERNRAYMLLETGETGERPAGTVVDSFGRKVYRRFSEHIVPDYMHTRVMHSPTAINPVRTQFSRLVREQAIALRKREKSRKIRYVAKLFQKFPDIDMEALKQKYPDVDVEKVRKYRTARGNHDKNRG